MLNGDLFHLHAYDMLLNTITISNNTSGLSDIITIDRINSLRISDLQCDDMLKDASPTTYLFSLTTLFAMDTSGNEEGTTTELGNTMNKVDLVQVGLRRSQVSLLKIESFEETTLQEPFNISINQLTYEKNEYTIADHALATGSFAYEWLYFRMEFSTLDENSFAIRPMMELHHTSNEWTFSQVLFRKNAGTLLHANPLAGTLPLRFLTCQFRENWGSKAILILNLLSELHDEHGTYSDNTSLGKGGVLYAGDSKAFANFTDTTLLRNAALYGGCFYVEYESDVHCTRCMI